MGEVGEGIMWVTGGRGGTENQRNSLSIENNFSSVFSGEACNSRTSYHYRFTSTT